MAAFVFKDAQIRYSNLDMTGVLNTVEINYEADMQDASVFGTSSRIRLSGLTSASVTQSGFWSATEDALAFSRIGAALPEVLSVSPDGVVDNPAFALLVDQSGYTLGGAVGEIHPFSIEAQSNGPLINGFLMGEGNKTVTGSSTIIQIGAVAAGQAVYASLHVIFNGGDASQTLDVIVESDDSGGFGSPTTQLTFDQVTTTNVAQWKVQAGEILDDFWRVTWTIAGTGSPNYTIFIVVGII